MTKEVLMTFQVEPELKQEFAHAADAEHVPTDQILREFMRSYVVQSRERHAIAANVVISASERSRREAAASFALACVGLEGFKPSKQALDKTRRHINGEIQLSEVVRVKSDA